VRPKDLVNSGGGEGTRTPGPRHSKRIIPCLNIYFSLKTIPYASIAVHGCTSGT